MTTTETPPPETDPATPPPETPEPDPLTETVKQLEHWKDMAKKQEDRAKANAAAAKELEQLKASTMSDTEKAVAQAKLEGRTEARREAAGALVLAEIRAAAAGRSVDVDTLLEGIDASRFLDSDGEPDRKTIVGWVEKVAPAAGATAVDLGQGVRGGQGSSDPAQEFAKFINNQRR